MICTEPEPGELDLASVFAVGTSTESTKEVSGTGVWRPGPAVIITALAGFGDTSVLIGFTASEELLFHKVAAVADPVYPPRWASASSRTPDDAEPAVQPAKLLPRTVTLCAPVDATFILISVLTSGLSIENTDVKVPTLREFRASFTDIITAEGVKRPKGEAAEGDLQETLEPEDQIVAEDIVEPAEKDPRSILGELLATEKPMKVPNTVTEIPPEDGPFPCNKELGMGESMVMMRLVVPRAIGLGQTETTITFLPNSAIPAKGLILKEVSEDHLVLDTEVPAERAIKLDTVGFWEVSRPMMVTD